MAKVENQIIGLVTAIFLLTSCELDSGDYSDIPFISFKKITVTDSVDILGNPSARLVNLHFYLIDGDGNIGPIYTINDTGPQPNCKVNFFYKDSQGNYIQDTLIESYTIPEIGDLGQDVLLKADIFIDITYNIGNPLSATQFFYSVQVFDKSLQASNILHTDTVNMEPD